MRLILIFVCLGLGIYLILPREAGFHPRHLYREIPEENSPDFSHPLTQNYYLIGKGAQFYAFESEDHSTVLKLFKARHYRPQLSRTLKHLFSSSARASSKRRWKQKFDATSNCYETAFKELKNETGLLALHLKKTKIPNLTVQLIDRHKKYPLDLNEFPFVVQKKAILVPEYLNRFLINHEPEKARAALQKVRMFFEKRVQKGFSDKRQCLRINYGFVDEQMIQIDPGKIHLLQTDPEQEIERLHARLDRWILKHYKELQVDCLSR